MYMYTYTNLGVVSHERVQMLELWFEYVAALHENVGARVDAVDHLRLDFLQVLRQLFLKAHKNDGRLVQLLQFDIREL